MMSGHVYSVLSYSSADKTVSLRNPWVEDKNHEHRENNGNFTLSLDDFDKYFTLVSHKD